MSPRLFAASLLLLSWCLPAAPLRAAEKSAKAASDGKEAMEAATRLQVFLDRAGFAPGKIDGHYGEFTVRALSLYRQAQGAPPADENTEAAKKGAAPDVSGLDLSTVEPLFLDYTVTEDDVKSIGRVPASVPEQAKEKSLPYRDPAEAIAEKFHTDVDYLLQLNPGKGKAIKPGDTLKVPNVEPFELAAVKDLQPGSEVDPKGANELGDDADPADAPSKDEKKPAASKETPEPAHDAKATSKKKGAAEKAAEPAPSPISVKVDTKTKMLTIYDAEKLIAAYPVTIGSAQTASPLGEWKVKAIAKMPNFRYDKAMLTKGERSSDFHLLPPGPNNPVGVIWIALNKKGIGLHGTDDPDSIGRSASHGCVRLANWDIARLATKVKPGVPVSIH